MTKLTANNIYQDLLKKITKIYNQAQVNAAQALDHIRTESYWQIGREIIQVEQKNQIRAEYGVQLVQSLSEDLTKRLGDGFSTRNLFYMRQFFLAYPILQAPAKSFSLTWTHYQMLSCIKDEKLRKSYERQTLKLKWSTRELEDALKKDQVVFESMPQLTHKIGSTSTKVEDLPVKRGVLHSHFVFERKDNAVWIDRGFFNYYKMILAKGQNFKEGDVVELIHKADSNSLKASFIKKNEVYTYVAIKENIIDGDTLVCRMYFGEDSFTRQRLRLRFIDAPEIDTLKGKQAKKFVEEALSSVNFFILKTYSTDVHGRFLADIFYLPGETDPAIVAQTGKLLNQELLDQHLAVRI